VTLSIENNHLILRTKHAAYLWKPGILPFRWSFKTAMRQIARFDEIQKALIKERCDNKHYLESYTGMNEDGAWVAVDDEKVVKNLQKKLQQ